VIDASAVLDEGDAPDVSETLDDRDMTMASGIAAFEAKHFARAARLLSPLAEEGDAEAQYRMAIMLQNGLGMTANRDLAFRYMRSAAEAGHGLAQHGLGFMYLEGECAPKDEAAAAEWFREAAEQGLQGSMTTLGLLYQEGRGVARDPEQAAYWYRKAGFEME
jgi:hypothetical protein